MLRCSCCDCKRTVPLWRGSSGTTRTAKCTKTKKYTVNSLSISLQYDSHTWKGRGNFHVLPSHLFWMPFYTFRRIFAHKPGSHRGMGNTLEVLFFLPPSFCGICLGFCSEKGSTALFDFCGIFYTRELMTFSIPRNYATTLFTMIRTHS